MMKFNPILATDSYKMSHFAAYPANVEGMWSYIEARTGGRDIMIPFGLQMFIKKFLLTPFTKEDVAEAKVFANKHGEPFNEEGWNYILKTYQGFIPVTIHAVPEGTPVPSGHAIVSLYCTDPKAFWVVSYIETMVLRGIWYPTTIATMDYDIKKRIRHMYEITGADMGLLPFALHDFGGRGVTSAEQAEIGGAAHLVNFMGSDTVEGVRAANEYYNEDMAAFSVPATEHSIECSFGGSEDQEEEYLRHVLKTMAKPGGIVSIVIDGYDVYRAAQKLCSMKNEIIASGAKVVFRPDSGDMMEVVPRILEMQDMVFGHTITSKGYKKVNTVGIIQGDGVDHDSLMKLLNKLAVMGYSADNVVFGSGGGLLQKVNRDTYKFAMKASAVLVDTVGEGHVWKPIAKNPVTDPVKKSKSGCVKLYRSKMTRELMTLDSTLVNSDEFEDMMKIVYSNGMVFNTTTLAQIRSRCAI